MKLINTIAAALALCPISASAERKFYNPGNLNGWDYIRRENNGTVEAVTNVAYKGGNALKMTQTYTPGYTGRYHSEVDHNQGYKRGDQLFYGFAFRLSEQWEFQPQSYNLAQFIANRPGASCGGDDWMPSSMLWLEGDQLVSRVVSGQYRVPDCSRDIQTFPKLAKVSAGQWHKVVIQASWKSDNTGFYKIWFDGNKVLEEYNRKTTLNDDSVFQFRIGLYANAWHDDKHMEGSQSFRQVWYDEVAIGTTFADVDPGQPDSS
ncbi:hypothetical protein Neosp_012858 [[Neocosmospora] mangrovei]